ncbi:MAG: hypothetical protein AAFO96_29720, partial [Bacteroidota bacterium]
MDQKWSMHTGNNRKVKGKDKKFWVKAASTLFKEGICTPEKGNVGEVFVALYFLFCADMLRTDDYNTFSVDLLSWWELLKSGGGGRQSFSTSTGQSEGDTSKKRGALSPLMDDERSAKKQKTTFDSLDQQITEHVANTSPTKASDDPTEASELKNNGASITFSAIQVCRNYIRSYNDSWSTFRHQGFLESLYKSGVGFYVFAGCHVIDMVFALRVQQKDEMPSFIPLVVSVKSRVSFSEKEAQTECARMTSKMKKTKASCGALCLLVVLGGYEKGMVNEENEGAPAQGVTEDEEGSAQDVT